MDDVDAAKVALGNLRVPDYSVAGSQIRPQLSDASLGYLPIADGGAEQMQLRVPAPVQRDYGLQVNPRLSVLYPQLMGIQPAGGLQQALMGGDAQYAMRPTTQYDNMYAGY